MEEAKGIVRHIQTVHDPVILRSFRGPDKGTLAVSFDPNMRQVAAGGTDNIVRVYSFKPQGRDFKFVGHTAPVCAVAFSPDGETIASGGEDRTLKLWKNNVYGKCHSVRGHIGSVRSISFASDGTFLVTSSDDKTIKGWNVAKHKFMFALPGHTNWVRSVKVAPDARVVVSGSDDSTVRLWDVETAKELQRFKEHQGGVYGVDWISDGTAVCGGGADGKINLWDVRSMKLIQHYEVAKHAVNSLSVHPSGCYLTSGDEDGVVKVFDLRQGRLAWSLHSHKAAVKNVTFNKAGDYFASCGAEMNCLIWKTNFDEGITRTQIYVITQQVAWSISWRKVGLYQAQLGVHSTTKTTFKANKSYQVTVAEQSDQKVVYKTPQDRQHEALSVALSGRFEKVVNQLERITSLLVRLDERITANEAEVTKLYQNPKCQKVLKQYEDMFRNTSQVNAVWEHFQQQHSAASKPNQQSFNEDIFPEPIFETGSFMRKELVDDYPDDSDRKLQLEYEQERRQPYGDSPTLTLQGPGNQFYSTNPFQSGALSSTITQQQQQQFQTTVQQTFSTRMNLQEQLGGLGEWRSQLEELQRELDTNEQVIREEEEDEDDQPQANQWPQQGEQIQLENQQEPQFHDEQGNQGEEEEHPAEAPEDDDVPNQQLGNEEEAEQNQQGFQNQDQPN